MSFVYKPAEKVAPAVRRRERDAQMAGNDLPRRWRNRPRFTVCEIGFAVGAGFLDLWRAWRADAQRPACLHVLAIEPHPLAGPELARALYADCANLSDALGSALIAQWPPLLPGVHRLEFEAGRITLTLVFGALDAALGRQTAQADAFFLNAAAGGDARTLARGLVRLAAPRATVAVPAGADSSPEFFGELRDAGFIAADMPAPAGLTALRLRDRTSNRRQGVFGAERVLDPARHAVVVGAGLAGAGIAEALARRGWGVTVIAPAAWPESVHSAAALTPMISRDDDFRARLTRAGSQRALARWRHLAPEGIVRHCATVEVTADTALAAEWAETVRRLAFPDTWVRAVGCEEACELSGLPLAGGGVYFADGLLVQPVRLIAALLRHAAIDRVTARVGALREKDDGWDVLDDNGRALATASTVILANAIGVVELLRGSHLLHGMPKLQAAHALGGEVTHIPAWILDGGPRCIVGGEGYLLPAVGGSCVIGSTYVHGAVRSEISVAGQRGNLAKAAGLLAGGETRLGGLAAGELAGWAGWRAVLPGRLPGVGPLAHAPGVWIATGYGSRGLTWSALMGDLIAAGLDGEPLPLENDLIRAIAPR